MIDTIVIVGDITKDDAGFSTGRRGYAYGLDAPSDIEESEPMMLGDTPPAPNLRGARVFAVTDGGNTDELVDMLSKEYAGREIKVFKLSGIFSRTVGEMVSKRVEQDGVLP